jgi:hypothetical protein
VPPTSRPPSLSQALRLLPPPEKSVSRRSVPSMRCTLASSTAPLEGPAEGLADGCKGRRVTEAGVGGGGVGGGRRGQAPCCS